MREQVAEIYGSEHDDWLRVFFAYDPDLIEDLKDSVSSYARRWDPTSRCWLILPSQRRLLLKLLERHGHEVKETPSSTAQHTPSSSPRSDPFESLLEAIPPDLRSKVYRQLSIVLHPDNGGDTELMKRLNVTWDKMGGRKK